MGSESMDRYNLALGRASSDSVVRVRRDPEAWLRWAWEEETPRALAAALGTLSVGYRAALLARGWLYDTRLLKTGRLPCPVVSLGNVTVGGSGKTPLAELATLTLVALGAAPAVVSRGYGRVTRGVQVVAARRRGGAAAPRRAPPRDPRDRGREPLRGGASCGGGSRRLGHRARRWLPEPH